LYTESNGTACGWIHAVFGIWSHTDGQVSGSAWAGTTTMRATAKPPTTKIVATITRTGITPVRAQS